jgi:hypothetical protein
MAADLGVLQDRFPEVEIGSYPFHEGGRYGARLLLTASDDERLGEAAQALDTVLARLGDAGVWEPQ